MTLEPGGFHQFTGVLGRIRNGCAYVYRSSGNAPFYAYGVINDQANSDGSFIFPVPETSLAGILRHTLPVIVETGEFTSELTVTNFSFQTKTLQFDFVADGLATPDRTARFSLTLEHREQRIIPDVIDTEMRRKGVAGIPRVRGGLAGALFATAERGDMSGIVIGARTSSSDGRGGQYGVFYNAVPDGAAFTESAWVDGLQQDSENRSQPGPGQYRRESTHSPKASSTLRSTTETPAGWSGRSRPSRSPPGAGARSTPSRPTMPGEPPRAMCGSARPPATNPFLAYGVVNDGGAPGQRSGDGAYVPARK